VRLTEADCNVLQSNITYPAAQPPHIRAPNTPSRVRSGSCGPPAQSATPTVTRPHTLNTPERVPSARREDSVAPGWAAPYWIAAMVEGRRRWIDWRAETRLADWHEASDRRSDPCGYPKHEP
jgi:hypothetical protein